MSENLNKGSEKGFGLPDGYFGRSAGSLMQRIQWLDEHKEFPRLTELRNASVFSVPADFFAKNGVRLELIGYSELSKIQRTEPFDVPVGFFETTIVSTALSLRSNSNSNKIPE